MRKTLDGTLYEIRDVAERTGLQYKTLWARAYQGKTLPAPTVQVGRRWFYTPEDFGRILWFLGDSAEVCG